MALRLATAGARDLAYEAAVDRFCDRLKAEGCGFVGSLETRDGCRKLIAIGEIDADACAGYLARCLASLANEA